MARERVSILLEAKDRASREIREAEGTLGKLRASGRAAAIALTAVAAATAVAVRGFVQLAKRGGEVIGVQRAFNRLFPEGTSAIEGMRQATRGLISDMDLMTQANRAVALGAVASAEQFNQLAEAALALGRAQGVDAAYALESLALGIGRQSRLLLDNLGLIVSVEDANRRYAASLGVTVDQLTQAQQKEAFRVAALEAAREKVEQLGGVTATNADNIQRMATAWTNAKDRAATFVAESPAIAAALDRIGAAASALAESLKGVDWGRLGAVFQTLAERSPLPFIGPAATLLRPKPKPWTSSVGVIQGPEPITRPGAPILPSAPVPGTPGFNLPSWWTNPAPLNVPMPGFGLFGIPRPGQVPGTTRGPLSHGLTMDAPTGEFDKMLLGLSEDLEDVANEGNSLADTLGVAMVGSLQALATAAITGGRQIEQVLIPAIANIVSNIPGVGGLAGSIIGAVGGIFTALAGRDRGSVPVRVTDMDERAAQKIQPKERDVQLYIDGRRATGEEEQRILGYQLNRVSRLQGESSTGV